MFLAGFNAVVGVASSRPVVLRELVRMFRSPRASGAQSRPSPSTLIERRVGTMIGMSCCHLEQPVDALNLSLRATAQRTAPDAGRSGSRRRCRQPSALGESQGALLQDVRFPPNRSKFDR